MLWGVYGETDELAPGALQSQPGHAVLGRERKARRGGQRIARNKESQKQGVAEVSRRG